MLLKLLLLLYFLFHLSFILQDDVFYSLPLSLARYDIRDVMGLIDRLDWGAIEVSGIGKGGISVCVSECVCVC